MIEIEILMLITTMLKKKLDNINLLQSLPYGPVRGATQSTSDARFDPLKANVQMNTYAWPSTAEQQTYGMLPSMGWPVEADYAAYGLNNLLFPGASQAFTNPQAAMAMNPALAMSLNPLVNPLVNPLMNPFASALQGAFTAGIPDGKQHALFVFHLPEDIDDHGLLQLFGPYGAIRANVMRQEDGRTRGFGFVHFNNRHDASIAIEMMNGHQIGRKRLMVSFKKEKDEPMGSTNNGDIQQKAPSQQ